ncbi:MAG TPA: sigma 54-interacting transcriptional regulator [Polyangia bacterium]|nr:sigma 54-interacting transcriptional regulator [Polyangia bacterium]
MTDQPADVIAGPRPGIFGRERELDRLEALYSAARDSRGGRVAFVTGEAGIGKSRLLDELRHRLKRAEVLVLEGRCREVAGGALPYQPIREIVEAAVASLGDAPGIGDRGREVLQALDGRAGQHDPSAERDSSPWELKRAALFEQVASFLVDVARPRPLCILVHDLHLADGATHGLVAHLAQTRLGAPELEGRASAAERLWGLLAVSSRGDDSSWLAGAAAERIDLGALDEGGVRAFLQSPEVVAFFTEATGGRPRALEALLETRPAGADEIYRARLERLSPEARALLHALAVLARPAGLDELRRVSNVADDALGRAAAELVQARITSKLVVDGELRLAFLRSGDEEVTYRGLDAAIRRTLHAVAGRLMRQASAPGRESCDDCVAVAEHLLRGAVGEDAVDAAIVAGERLEITFGYDRAIDLYRRAYATTTRDDVRALVEARLCELERLVGDYAAALENAERLRRRQPDAAAHRRIAQLHVLRDELDLALGALETAQALAGSSTERSRVRAARAEAYFLAGRHAEAKAECAAALDAADDDVEAQDRRLQVQNTLGKVLLAEGNYQGASEIFTTNLQQARALGRAFEECRALYNLGIAQLRLGNSDQAQARYQAALKVAEAAGDHRNRAFCLQNLGVLAHWRNDYATALTYFHDAVSAFKTIGQRARLAWLALDLASVYLDLNELDRAQAMAELAERFAGGTLPAAVAIDREQLAGRILARRGDLDGARARLENARERAAAAEDHERSVEALLHLVRLDLERGDVARAAERLGDVGNISSQGTRARALLVQGELEVSRGEPQAARRVLLEAAELFHRLGDLEGEWRAHLWLGRAAQARGDQPEADRRYRTAHTIDGRVRERVPDEHRAAHADEPLRRALERALGLPRVLPLAAAGEATRAPRLVPVEPAAKTPESRYPRLVGRHARLLQVFSLLDKIAPHDSLVLIRGESGTGKELIADALHAGSPRASRPLVKVNCGALVETLLLSELFGHERGAFTGALARKKGRFEAADGGTIFLDEIGDISPKTQVALLRVLQEREFERVGGNTPVKVDVRILCATNRNLEQMVARGEFREDLYYRLKGIQIELPALRERPGDVALLAEAFLDRVADERSPTGESARKQLSPEAMALLERYSWPGNVRELENVIRSVSLFADGPVIGVKDFADYTEIFRRENPPAAEPAAEKRPQPIAPSPDGGEPASWSRLGSEKLSLKALKTRIEIECITEALTAARGNITRAAEILGMKRPRLSQLIKQHGITVDGGSR